MTKSELIELIAAKQSHLPAKDVELAVSRSRDHDDAARAGTAHRDPRLRQLQPSFPPAAAGAQPEDGRDRGTGRQVRAAFQAGKDLRERVNEPLDEPRSAEHPLAAL